MTSREEKRDREPKGVPISPPEWETPPPRYSIAYYLSKYLNSSASKIEDKRIAI